MSLRDLLPESYRSPVYWDDEAAMRAYVEDVRALARESIHACAFLDRLANGGDRAAHEQANDLHGAAECVAPGIVEEMA